MHSHSDAYLYVYAILYMNVCMYVLLLFSYVWLCIVYVRVYGIVYEIYLWFYDKHTEFIYTSSRRRW